VCDGTTALTPTPIRVDQRVDSAGFSDAGAAWQSLGTFTITGSTLVVKMTDDANSYLNADAVRIERSGFPGGIIDRSGAGFTPPTGTWVRGSTTPASKDFQGSKSYAEATPTPGTATATARWTFTVAPGTYRVTTTYQGYPWAATDAPFCVFDGDTKL